MKKTFIKILKITLVLLVLFTFSQAFIGNVSFAQIPNDYVPISDLPGISESEPVDLNDPSKYFSNLFTIFIVLASTLAVVRLILCGITYMTSESVSTKTDSKSCIWGVLAGLFIILLSVIILGQINKDFLKIDFSFIKETVESGAKNVGGERIVAPENAPGSGFDDDAGSGGGGGGGGGGGW